MDKCLKKVLLSMHDGIIHIQITETKHLFKHVNLCMDKHISAFIKGGFNTHSYLATNFPRYKYRIVGNKKNNIIFFLFQAPF